jgi:hypothetical protein
MEAALLIRATRKWTDIHLVGPLIVPLLAGSASAGLGWTISELDGRDLLSGVIGGSTAVACFLIILLVLQTTRLRETFRFVLGSVRAGASRGEPAGTVPERDEAPGPATVSR